ncbi:MAG: hypothetical protein ACYDH5_18040 [Acidimicrobiales bacterium]
MRGQTMRQAWLVPQAKDACTPHWYNDPFHLTDTVEALLQADHQLVAR